MQGLGWLAAIIVGGLAGWIASSIMKADTGIILNVILGIVGAIVGNALLGLVGLNAFDDGGEPGRPLAMLGCRVAHAVTADSANSASSLA